MWKWPTDTSSTTVLSRCSSCQAAVPSEQIVYTTRTGCDFFGFTRHGRVIMLEAKEHQGPSLPIDVADGHGVKHHQMTHLRDCHRAGGIALVVWRRDREVAVLDVDMIERLSSGRRSVAWAAIPESFRRPLNVYCLDRELDLVSADA